MAEQSAQQEPSMEEILASIRRIISEDAEDEATGEEPEGPKEVVAEAAASEPGPAPEPEPEPEAETLQSAEPDAAPEEAALEEAAAEQSPEPEGADTQPEAVQDVPIEAAPEPEATMDSGTAQAPQPVQGEQTAFDEADDVLELTNVVPAPGGVDPIVSHTTEAATSQHLAALSGLVVRNYAGAENTLEGLVREMLKPMLQQWLDQNLPSLVETLVNREIERIAGRDK
ncbi:MAG: DUF2497 domain-containing protein [Pseudomonadota bacterium]